MGHDVADPLPEVTATVNGVRWWGHIDPRWTLLEFLRGELRLTGTKRGCEVLACGACTVLLDDRPVSACGTLAVDIHGADVWTIEGLTARGDARFAALQQAFVDEVGFQCGFCTPGQLCLAQALFRRDATVGDDIPTRDWMADNLCRCGSYLGILAAVERARG